LLKPFLFNFIDLLFFVITRHRNVLTSS